MYVGFRKLDQLQSATESAMEKHPKKKMCMVRKKKKLMQQKEKDESQ